MVAPAPGHTRGDRDVGGGCPQRLQCLAGHPLERSAGYSFRRSVIASHSVVIGVRNSKLADRLRRHHLLRVRHRVSWGIGRSGTAGRSHGGGRSIVARRVPTALEAWIALAPNENPDAPSTPFDLPEYTNARQEEGERLQGAAEESFEGAKDANQNGDDYVLATVFFASVLFFAGISAKFVDPRIQGSMLTLATIALAGGITRILTLPFH